MHLPSKDSDTPTHHKAKEAHHMLIIFALFALLCLHFADSPLPMAQCQVQSLAVAAAASASTSTAT